MYNIRTDLAIERHEMSESTEGVQVQKENNDGVKITRVTVSPGAGERAVGKKAGTYVTIEAEGLEYSTELYEATCRAIAKQLRTMADIRDDSVALVVGLGNDRVTPDALGPDTVKKIMVTHHIKQHMSEYLDEGIRSVCAVAPGVLGTTGIETASIVKGITDAVKPDVVIAVDALASRSLSRIGCTVQLSDTGIAPGGGVGNRREGLNEETLGVKVIAVGVPTVTDAGTAALDVMSQNGAEPDEKTAEKVCEGMGALVITPKNIDLIIEKASKTVANGINMALHKDVTFEYIESYVG